MDREVLSGSACDPEVLSGPTFRDCCSTSGFLPTLDDAHDGHRLGRKRMPLQLLQCRPDRIVWTVQGRKPGKHKLAQRRTIRAAICGDISYVIHILKPLEQSACKTLAARGRRADVVETISL